MKNMKIKICDAVIQPGEIANLALPLPEQYSCSPLFMPIKVIHGVKKGPCLVIFSGLKGTELNGLEIANRIGSLIQPDQLSGTLISIPAINVYGLTHYPVTLPMNHNLEACFPGDENGSFGERIAYLFNREILRKADYCIELQTGGLNHKILPQVYCNFGDAQSKELAKVFQAPVVTNVSVDRSKLRKTAEALKIPLLVYQAGEAMRFDESAIKLGVDGVQNVMRAIDMLIKDPLKEIQPIFSSDEEWIVSNKGGILHPSVTLGQTIREGDLIGMVTDPFGIGVIERIKSKQEGIVVGINAAPIVHEGLPIFKIASFFDYKKAENVIEKWDQLQQDSVVTVS